MSVWILPGSAEVRPWAVPGGAPWRGGLQAWCEGTLAETQRAEGHLLEVEHEVIEGGTEAGAGKLPKWRCLVFGELGVPSLNPEL